MLQQALSMELGDDDREAWPSSVADWSDLPAALHLAGLAQAPTSLPSIACLPARHGVISGYLMLCAGT